MGYKRTVRYGSPGGSLLLRFFYSGFTRGEYHVVYGDSNESAVGFGRFFYNKESAVGLCRFFWLSQCGIPYRTCRFYFLLAGAVEERQGISIPYPSPTPLLTPLGIRCGGAYLLPRVYTNTGSCIPVLSLLPSSEFCSGALCSGWYRSRFSRVAQLVSFVFHYWGGGRLFLRLRGVLLFLS